MTASKIHDLNVMDYHHRNDEQHLLEFMTDYVNKEIERLGIERILVPDNETFDYMQSKKTKPFTNEVIFNIGKKVVKTH